MVAPFLTSTLLTIGLLGFGTILLHFEFITFGFAYFIVLPLVAGYIAGGYRRDIGLLGLFTGVLILSLILYLANVEGIVCMLMAFPLMILALFVGLYIRLGIDQKRKRKSDKNRIQSSIMPLLVFLGFAFGERQLLENNPSFEEVQTEMILPYTPTTVYDAIKEFDTLDTKKSWLMKLDLPVPQKCILENESVGSKRICYFEGGKIIQEIKEMERGKIMRMDVIDYQLTGRKWLGFTEAVYAFDSLKNGGTRISRISVYSSQLKPRWYWRNLEKMGIEQEHDYVFRQLRINLDSNTLR